MVLPFTLTAIVAFGLSLAATYGVRALAWRYGAIDKPSGVESSRKIHQRPTALWGGLGIYAAFALTMAGLYWFNVLPSGSISSKHVLGLLLGGLLLVIGGVLDDKYNLKPKQQIIWPIAATLVVIASGIGIESITSPFGGQWFLDQVDIRVWQWNGVPYKITLFSDAFTVAWLLGVMYATKFFDGLDGLVSGLTVIGALVVAAVSLTVKIAQPETALIALVVAACFAGFLMFNFNPASIFLGESGSTLAGFLLATLAIISESKVTTTLVIMSLPILDLIWVISRRVFFEHVPATRGDRKHIHHRLLDVGFSPRRAVLLFYAWAVACGLFAMLYQGRQQWYVLFAAMLAMLALAAYLVRKPKQV